MTITIRPNWKRSMERAQRDSLKPTKLVNGTYRVRSTSHPGTFHIVSLDASGHIAHCSDCPGWATYGRANPCKHAGAVAIAIAWQLGAHLSIERDDKPIFAICRANRRRYGVGVGA